MTNRHDPVLSDLHNYLNKIDAADSFCMSIDMKSREILDGTEKYTVRDAVADIDDFTEYDDAIEKMMAARSDGDTEFMAAAADFADVVEKAVNMLAEKIVRGEK